MNNLMNYRHLLWPGPNRCLCPPGALWGGLRPMEEAGAAAQVCLEPELSSLRCPLLNLSHVTQRKRKQERRGGGNGRNLLVSSQLFIMPGPPFCRCFQMTQPPQIFFPKNVPDFVTGQYVSNFRATSLQSIRECLNLPAPTRRAALSRALN